MMIYEILQNSGFFKGFQDALKKVDSIKLEG